MTGWFVHFDARPGASYRLVLASTVVVVAITV